MEEGNSFRMSGQKILVVRFSAMGDIVLTSPVVRLLKIQLNAEVHFLTKNIFADLWIENPYLSKIWTIDKGEIRRCYRFAFQFAHFKFTLLFVGSSILPL